MRAELRLQVIQSKKRHWTNGGNITDEQRYHILPTTWRFQIKHKWYALVALVCLIDQHIFAFYTERFVTTYVLTDAVATSETLFQFKSRFPENACHLTTSFPHSFSCFSVCFLSDFLAVSPSRGWPRKKRHIYFSLEDLLMITKNTTYTPKG